MVIWVSLAAIIRKRPIRLTVPSTHDVSGLPKIAAAEPALDAQASASKNGTESSLRAWQFSTRSGAIATATTLSVSPRVRPGHNRRHTRL
jgi:hypothetical protein